VIKHPESPCKTIIESLLEGSHLLLHVICGLPHTQTKYLWDVMCFSVFFFLSMVIFFKSNSFQFYLISSLFVTGVWEQKLQQKQKV
jgi:hypothetical protein